MFCVADVSGKGIAAALLMSNIQATFHSLVNYTHNLKDIIIELNKRVWHNAKGEKFVSLFLGKINTKSKQLTYINAGHNPPMLFNGGKVVNLAKGCTLLGISEIIPAIEVEIMDMQQGYTLFCYTDGLTDTVNSTDEYLTEESVVSLISKNMNTDPSFINDAIMYYAEEFKGENQFVDDIALLTIKCN
jgi:sigma-B regulation protein RsbU (phosphoserine phosphatase)